MRGDLVKKLALRCSTVGLAVLAFLLAALTGERLWGLGLAVAAVIVCWLERRANPGMDLGAESTLIAAGVLVAHNQLSAAEPRWPVIFTAAALLGLILAERPLRQTQALRTRAVNLPVRSWPSLVATHLNTAVLVLLAALAAGAALALPPWPGMVATLLVAVVGAVTIATMAWRRLRPSGTGSPITQALSRHQPQFLLHFSAPRGSEYQALMWLPYLERIGRPFAVVVREAHLLPRMSAATKAPVILCPTPGSLDEVVVPSLRAAFYVNHGAQNNHLVRFRQLTHIQLHHGDSDKASSANPASAIYDKIFVAGPAAIDRYARNGVAIPRDRFVIVGRPQVESITGPRGHIRTLTDRVVLYTPTWIGHNSDANYSSLRVGAMVVERLLARGVTVIMRPHPYTFQHPPSARQAARIEELLSADRARTGRQHLWGVEAMRKMTLVDCVNRSDALISDVSGVVSDYLFSGKPYAVTDMVGEGDRFAVRFPLARGGYVLRSDLTNLDQVLDLLLTDDPLADLRGELRSEYLGDFPAESYADGFLAAARQFLQDPVPTLPTPRPFPEALPSPVTNSQPTAH